MTYEPEVATCFDKFVEPGDLVIDCGAGTGTHTRRLAELVGPSGQVIAFEPDSRSFALLDANVSALANVRLSRTALWSHDAALTLWSIEQAGYSSVAHRYDNVTSCETVAATTLDSVLDGARPRLVKLDAEGAEEEILAGAVQTLTRGVDCIICELNFYLLALMRRSDHGVRDLMAGLGYSMFVIGSFDPIRVEPPVELQLRNGVMVNVMFSTEELVRQRWPAAA